jgi:segregation and condensation protein B
MSDHTIHTTNAVARAEAFLFVEGGSMTTRKLAHLLGIEQKDIPAVLDELTQRLEGRALTIIRTETEVTLAVTAALAPVLRESFQRELGKEIGDAGLEVLSVLLYGGPATRARIDYIRGVNTSSTVRLLMSRGLIERTGNPDDAREYIYRPTIELLAHLGVTEARYLPEYATIAAELAAFEKGHTPASPFQSPYDTDFADITSDTEGYVE